MLSACADEIASFLRLKSNLIFQKITSIILNTHHYKPLRGGTFIKTPKCIVQRRAIINPDNKDDPFCFIWAVIIGLFDIPYEKAKYIANLKPYLKHINTNGLYFPINNGSDIDKFELLNKNRIAINVIGFDNENEGGPNFYPCRVSKILDSSREINLLLLTPRIDILGILFDEYLGFYL